MTSIKRSLNGISLLVLPIQNFFFQEELCFPAFIGEKTNISAETYKEDEVFNAEISNEEVGISFRNCHENSLHDYFQDQFCNV